MGFKIHNSDEIEGIKIKLIDYPNAFQAKCEEFVEEGQAKTIEEARKALKDTEIFLELYYEKGTSLFGVDSDAVEGCQEDIQSPYTGKYAEKSDDYEEC